MNNKVIHLFLVFCFILLGVSGRAQNQFIDPLSDSLYSTSLDIVNGEAWTYSKKYQGHPFLWNDEWYTADIIYNGINYKSENVKVRIDSDELIIFRKLGSEARIYNLNKQYLEAFTLYDLSKKAYHFRYDVLQTGAGKIFYTVLYRGETSFIVHHRKIINNTISGNYTGQYLYRPQMYLLKNQQLIEFDSKSTMLNLFGDKKTELKRYMRKNHIQFDRTNPEPLVSLFRYYDSIQ